MNLGIEEKILSQDKRIDINSMSIKWAKLKQANKFTVKENWSL